MKRESIALIIHPYKNNLIPQYLFKETINSFIEELIEASSSFKNIHFNLAMPGYYLDNIDSMLILHLREKSKTGSIEWLTTGYTEPFLSFFPVWLCNENIKTACNVFKEFIGNSPHGFMPAFSNWEPAYIDLIKNLGFQYVVLSNSFIEKQFSNLLGFWVTEFLGNPLVIFPYTSISLNFFSNNNFEQWLYHQFKQDNKTDNKLLCLDFLYPVFQKEKNIKNALINIFSVLEKNILSFKPVCLSEYLSYNSPLGLMYLPPSLAFKRHENEQKPYFLNYLFSFDQIGLIQRKIFDICEQIESLKESKKVQKILKKLFFVQDINHYIPSFESGFFNLNDRLYCYKKAIEAEKELNNINEVDSEKIKICDFYRNNSKIILMSNNNILVGIDYNNGGTIFELDYRVREINLCACLNPNRHFFPSIIEKDLSLLAFVDHFFSALITLDKYKAKEEKDLADFYFSNYDYKIKKVKNDLKVSLQRQGTIIQMEKPCPIGVEKVFGIQKNHSSLSFAYQLTNNSLTSYNFSLCIEMCFSLPGIINNDAFFLHKKRKYYHLSNSKLEFPQITQWALCDPYCGVLMHFILQKPVNLWVFSTFGQDSPLQDTLTMVISSPIILDGSGIWSLVGKINFRRIAIKRKITDEI
jgi:hypothetical protein